MNSPKRILVSANDPGGANAILPVIRMLSERGDSLHCIATGPALDQFRSTFLSPQYLDKKLSIGVIDGALLSDADLPHEIQTFRPDVFLAGVSIGDSIDKRILRQLKNTPSVDVIDFWSHYGRRFSEARADYGHLPSRVCVIDERMRNEMLAEGFPPERLVVTGNPHFEHFTEGITRDAEDKECAVFISQPIRKDDAQSGTQLEGGYDEYQVLETVVACLPAGMRLSIRLHPREEKNKFDSYLTGRVTIAGEATLEEALSHAGLVIGMFSNVLMQAAFAHKPTISYQPGKAGDDPLPSNALGITALATDEEELRNLFSSYTNGTFPRPESGVERVWPKGATEHVVTVIDGLSG